MSLSAHEALGRFIQHRVGLNTSGPHLDVTVELTFFEDWSQAERRAMDKDGDGRLTRAETETYLKARAEVFAEGVGLLVNGKRVDLIPLHAPVLDLLGDEGVGRSHHRLTLAYFARMSGPWAPGAEVLVEDLLWGEAAAIGLWEARGPRDGRLVVTPLADPFLPPASPGQPRRFHARWSTEGFHHAGPLFRQSTPAVSDLPEDQSLPIQAP